MSHFQSLRSYEEYIYNLPENFDIVSSSTLVVVRRSAKQAVLAGEILLPDAYHLSINERIDFADDQFRIQRYGYEIWKGKEKLYWYDSQPHPNDPSLAQNHPHHKHVPPNIKRNRIPAPEISFTKPNLPFLIREIEREYLT